MENKPTFLIEPRPPAWTRERAVDRHAFDGIFHEDACSVCGEVYEHANMSRLGCGKTCPSCFAGQIAGVVGFCEGTT